MQLLFREDRDRDGEPYGGRDPSPQRLADAVAICASVVLTAQPTN